jgi:hypothetical protein
LKQVLVLSSEDEESKKMVLAQFPEGTQQESREENTVSYAGSPAGSGERLFSHR